MNCFQKNWQHFLLGSLSSNNQSFDFKSSSFNVVSERIFGKILDLSVIEMMLPLLVPVQIQTGLCLPANWVSNISNSDKNEWYTTWTFLSIVVGFDNPWITSNRNTGGESHWALKAIFVIYSVIISSASSLLDFTSHFRKAPCLS